MSSTDLYIQGVDMKKKLVLMLAATLLSGGAMADFYENGEIVKREEQPLLKNKVSDAEPWAVGELKEKGYVFTDEAGLVRPEKVVVKEEVRIVGCDTPPKHEKVAPVKKKVKPVKKKKAASRPVAKTPPACVSESVQSQSHVNQAASDVKSVAPSSRSSASATSKAGK